MHSTSGNNIDSSLYAFTLDLVELVLKQVSCSHKYSACKASHTSCPFVTSVLRESDQENPVLGIARNRGWCFDRFLPVIPFLSFNFLFSYYWNQNAHHLQEGVAVHRKLSDGKLTSGVRRIWTLDLQFERPQHRPLDHSRSTVWLSGSREMACTLGALSGGAKQWRGCTCWDLEYCE